MGSFWDKVLVALEKYKRFIRIGAVCIGFVLMLIVIGIGGNDPISGAYRDYEVQTDNEKLHELLMRYYAAYAAGDIDKLEAIASPISDREKSYIKLMSKYIKGYDIEAVYTKHGIDDALLLSVPVKIHYRKIKEAAPGLDFFYVEPDKEGKYHINNRYSTFNSQNAELEVDPMITALVAAFEQQEDVVELQAEVTRSFNELTMEDKEFNTYFTRTLPNAVTDWVEKYKKEEAKKEKKAKKEAAKTAKNEKNNDS